MRKSTAVANCRDHPIAFIPNFRNKRSSGPGFLATYCNAVSLYKCMSLIAFAISIILATRPSLCQRLPGTATPLHYAIDLATDSSKNTFSGKEDITIGLDASTHTIVLNAVELNISNAYVGRQGYNHKLTPRSAVANEQLLLSSSALLSKGVVVLHLEFSGVIADTLRGLYRSKAAGRSYLLTQFEPTDARRAFPCFDEPQYKATFSLSVSVKPEEMAISNMPVLAERKVKRDGYRHLSFRTTPNMSTYLLALFVGPFECLSDSSDGVPVRVCTPPGKLALASTAMADAKHFLNYYDTYFSIPYPLPKLDLVAVPELSPGAMENFGAISFRETALLIDSRHESLAMQEQVASTIAHELAHQWFGDLVTMRWWNDLWLNEGFASWLSSKSVAEWRPDWKLDEDRTRDLDHLLTLDALPSTHPVSATVISPAEINSQFDGLTYGKAALILGMVESYEGAALFQKGIHRYLLSHAFKSAVSQDFWDQQARVTHLPVDAVLRSYVTQAGFPLVTANVRCDGSQTVVGLGQTVFPSQQPLATFHDPKMWSIPVCLSTAGSSISCYLLRDTTLMVTLPGCQQVISLNGGAHGYYRYLENASAGELSSGNMLKMSTPSEGILEIGNSWAMVEAGMQPVAEYLEEITQLRTVTSAPELAAGFSNLVLVQRALVSPRQAAGFSAWIAATLSPKWKLLDASKAGESDDQKHLRILLYGTLGSLTNDPEILTKANQHVQLLLKTGKGDADEDVNAEIVAARAGGQPLFDSYLGAIRQTTSPQLRHDLLTALNRFSDPLLVEKTLSVVLSGELSKTEALIVLSGLLSKPETSQQTWRFVTTHWTDVQTVLPPNGTAVLATASASFCDPAVRSEVITFFSRSDLAVPERVITRTATTIDQCIQLRTKQKSSFDRWFMSLAVNNGLSSSPPILGGGTDGLALHPLVAR